MGEKLFECEYEPGEGVVLRIKPFKAKILPASVKSHVRAARKEILLALRSLLDEVIEHVERTEKKEAGKGKTKIEVK